MGDGQRERVDLLFFGGSHMAAVGVPATSVFTVLVSRRLRAAWPAIRISTRGVFYSGNPADLPEAMSGAVGPAPSIVIVLPRNMHGIPMLLHLKGRLGAIFGHLAPPGLATRPVRRRLRTGYRLAAAAVLAASALPTVPGHLARYGRALDAAIDLARSGGATLIVLTTPIPLPLRRFPGAVYQGAFARLIRRRAAPDVRIADVLREGRKQRAARITQPADPLHLTPAGHRFLAEVLGGAILAPGSQDVAAAGRPRRRPSPG
ncbi:MAG: hypothetical protein ACREPA_04210 [Candidatus Dormibacteraceae bacterium]